MATGYTADVADGKITEFRDFAELCLRAFGVAVQMRDDPMHDRVPDELVMPEYYAKNVKERKAELAKAEALEGEALNQATYSANHAAERRNLERQQEKELTRQRYLGMLSEVAEWKPPTPEHNGIKTFMIEQLTESLKWDCSSRTYTEPTDLTPEEYKEQEVSEARRYLKFAEESFEEQTENYANKNAYLRAFRASLPD